MSVNHAVVLPRRTAHWRSRFAEAVGVCVGYVALAVIATWPLAMRFDDCLPMGSERARTVPFFNLWTVIWNIQCAEHALTPCSQAYWDAPIFFPGHNALAMSEPQPATQLLLPVAWITRNWTAVYNTYFLLSLTLNGLVTWCLFRRNGHSRPVSIGTGAAMLLLPIVFWQSGVVQLVPVWGLIWTLDSILHILQFDPNKSEHLPFGNGQSQRTHRGGMWIALNLAGGVVATFATSAHHGVMLVAISAVAAAIVALCYWREIRLVRSLQIGLGATVLCAFLIGPEVWQLATAATEHSLKRDAETVLQLSAVPSDYLAAWGTSVFDKVLAPPSRLWFLSPGLLITVLALAGAVWGVLHEPLRKLTIFWVSVVVAGFVFSMGQHLQVGPVNLWNDVASRLPGLGQIRSVFRFAFFVQIGCVVLAANLFALLEIKSAAQMNWNRARRFCANLFISSLGVWAVIDPWPSTMHLGVSPKQTELQAAWVNRLAEEPAGGVLVLPMADGGVVNDYEETTLWMLQGLVHAKPLVNGYSGFFPVKNLEISASLHSDGLTSQMIAELSEMGVKYVVVTRVYASRNEDWKALPLLYEDSAVKLYRLSD